MSTSNFTCTEHTVLGQHIRHYLRSSSLSQEDKFHLHVKQYTPHHSLPPQEGDVTILACHASGFPKELYEPFWDDLLAYSKRTGAFRIRNIWIADVFNQGQSGVFNEHKLGNERSFGLCYYSCAVDSCPLPSLELESRSYIAKQGSLFRMNLDNFLAILRTRLPEI